MGKTETVPLSLDNVGDGDASARFSEALAEIVEEYRRGESDGRKATVTMQFTVSFLDETGDSMIIACVACKATPPKRKARGRIVRFESGVPVIDLDETDSSGNRKLFTVKE